MPARRDLACLTGSFGILLTKLQEKQPLEPQYAEGARQASKQRWQKQTQLPRCIPAQKPHSSNKNQLSANVLYLVWFSIPPQNNCLNSISHFTTRSPKHSEPPDLHTQVQVTGSLGSRIREHAYNAVSACPSLKSGA